MLKTTQIIRFLKVDNGFAAIASVVAVLGLLLIFSGGFMFVTTSNTKVLQDKINSAQSYYTAESGVEDAVYRIKNSKQIAASNTFSIGSSSVTITADTTGNDRTILAEGSEASTVRRVQTKLSINATQSDFYYGVQVGQGGITMSGNSQIDGNVYSDGNIVGSGSSSITGDAIVAGGIADTPSVSWTSNDSDQFFATASTNEDIAQSFTANASDVLNRVDVYLGKVGAPTKDITLKIANDNSGKPATANIANTTISRANVGTTPSWISATFSSPPTLVSGTKYWIVLDYSANSATNYWNWRKDSSDGYANNTGMYTSNCCSGSPTWTSTGGDLAFEAWIGGTLTQISGVTIGGASSGTAHANSFSGTTVHGSACPNTYCIMDSQPQVPLPLSAGVIQDWKDAAAAGGTCGPPTCSSGNLNLSGTSTLSIGPKKITGNLTLTNSSVLTVTGTLWVQGNISISNSSIIKLDPAYGGTSGIVLTDGTATISNAAQFQGSGTAGSYVIVLSDKVNHSGTVISVGNGSSGVIYYASDGFISFSNAAGAKEATGYGINLANGATVTYESGLANVNFSSGPSGGWLVSDWKEVP